MSDPITVVVRFALYLDLMLLFGLACFGLYSLRGKERASGAVLNFSSLVYGTALSGIALSLVALCLLAKSMSGVSGFMELHHDIFLMLLTGTDVGVSWLVRIAALLMAIFGLSQYKRSPTVTLWIVTGAGAIALASLAWTGHGAMGEGSRGLWQLVGDVFHLLAAGAWLGALAAFALLLRWKSLKAEHEARILARVLKGFESVGAVIVFVISITGVFNYLFIVGARLDGVMLGTYGVLLFIKIALFGAMIALASLNRFHLSPLLERAVHNGEYSMAAHALRRSLALELSMAVIILVGVAWLGTLSPDIQLSAG